MKNLPIISSGNNYLIETVKLAVVDWGAAAISNYSVTKHGFHPLKVLWLIAGNHFFCVFVY